MVEHLLQLPHEVLHGILIHVAPTDLAALRCCHVLDNLVKHDGLLFKEVYQRHFVSVEMLLRGTELTGPCRISMQAI